MSWTKRRNRKMSGKCGTSGKTRRDKDETDGETQGGTRDETELGNGEKI